MLKNRQEEKKNKKKQRNQKVESTKCILNVVVMYYYSFICSDGHIISVSLNNSKRERGRERNKWLLLLYLFFT